MYSPLVVDKAQRVIEKGMKLKLKRYSASDSQEIAAYLNSLLVDGKLKRPLKTEERTFIQNERLLCQIDFRYFASRYATIALDGAVGLGIGRPKFWESQELTLALIAKCEEESYALYEAGEPATAICICQHKSRQLGCTMLARMMTDHRIFFWPYTRSMGASVDEPKVQDQLYKRDKVCYENLPWFLRPTLRFDVKNKHLEFTTGAYVMYQQSNQESGLGQGSQFDISHLTEVASWDYPNVIELDFIPTIPQSPYAFCILESTAQGRGDWWHEFTEKVSMGKMYGWHYCFWPWYINKSKYRAKPPENWYPSKVTQLHADLVRATSHQYVGHSVELSLPQLYWYEMNYQNAREKGELNLWLMNYAATAAQSFQFANVGAFDTELLDEFRMTAESAAHRSYNFVPFTSGGAN
jgi:hypothetical protein